MRKMTESQRVRPLVRLWMMLVMMMCTISLSAATTERAEDGYPIWSADNIQISAPVLKLMQNPAFRDRFLTRAAELLGESLTNEAILEEIDRQVSIIEPEVARDRIRRERTDKVWHSAVESLKQMVTGEDWRQCAIDSLVRVFGLEDSERAQYFTGIDKKAKP